MRDLAAPILSRHTIQPSMSAMSANTLTIRPAGPADDAFFAALYRSTRGDLLALPADPAMIDGLVAMQQRMQVAGYRDSYPDAQYQVFELDGVAVGRLVTALVNGAMRVVDIAVLPQARGHGVAGEALRRLQAQAAAEGRGLALAVRRDNATARRLYAALGFAVEGENDLDLELRWCAQSGSSV